MNLSQITTIYRLIAGDSDSDWGHGKWQASSWQAWDSIYWLFQPAFQSGGLGTAANPAGPFLLRLRGWKANQALLVAQASR